MSSRGGDGAKYALDTNVFVDAFKGDEAAAELDTFFRRALVVTFLSAVVVQELRAGARTRSAARTLERTIFASFERRGRVVTPSATAFKQSGEVLAALIARHGPDIVRGNRSLANDALLAASCREHGLTLVSNDDDFERIRSVLPGLRWVKPWPAGRNQTM